MAHAVTHNLHGVVALGRTRYREDDPLDAMRGILFGTVLSLVGFWLPLALLLTTR